MEESAGSATTTVSVGGSAIVLAVKDGQAFVPASLKLPNGASRFQVSFPKELGDTDMGAKYLVYHENKNGYEPPTRNLLERIFRPGDLFIDVGAHWGFFTLQAATHPAGDVAVIAFEPDPTNAGILLKNIDNNRLREKVSVVCAACGDDFDLAPLVTNSSMMHSVHGVGLKSARFSPGSGALGLRHLPRQRLGPVSGRIGPEGHSQDRRGRLRTQGHSGSRSVAAEWPRSDDHLGVRSGFFRRS